MVEVIIEAIDVREEEVVQVCPAEGSSRPIADAEAREDVYDPVEADVAIQCRECDDISR